MSNPLSPKQKEKRTIDKKKNLTFYYIYLYYYFDKRNYYNDFRFLIIKILKLNNNKI